MTLIAVYGSGRMPAHRPTLGVRADYEELTEPLLARLSLYAHRRIEVAIRFGFSSGP
jgi:hypothetical protein